MQCSVGHSELFSLSGVVFVSLGMQHQLEDLLYEYRVDLALWAHYHNYERTCALHKLKCVEDGITHIIIGTAGMDENTEPYMKVDWSLFRRNHNSYGYGRVTVANRSALHFEYFVNSENKVVDDVWLTKTTRSDLFV